MAIRVFCPQGCRLQVPASRAGTILRCPSCGNHIKVAEQKTIAVGEDGMQTLASRMSTDAEIQQMREQVVVRPSLEPKKRTKSVVEGSTESPSRVSLPPSISNQSNGESGDVPNETELVAKGDNSPKKKRKSRKRKRWRLPGEKSKFESWERKRLKQAHELKLIESEQPISSERFSPSLADDEEKNADSHSQDLPDQQNVVGVEHSLPTRARAMWLSFVLFAIGVFLLIPAAAECYEHFSAGSNTPISRWVACLVFLGTFQFFLAVYLFQLADWTAMIASAIVLATITFFAALLLAGLAVGPQAGFLPRTFQIPVSLVGRAEIWLLMLLTITSVVGYYGGREALRWKQTEARWRIAEHSSPPSQDNAAI